MSKLSLIHSDYKAGPNAEIYDYGRNTSFYEQDGDTGFFKAR